MDSTLREDIVCRRCVVRIGRAGQALQPWPIKKAREMPCHRPYEMVLDGELSAFVRCEACQKVTKLSPKQIRTRATRPVPPHPCPCGCGGTVRDGSKAVELVVHR